MTRALTSRRDHVRPDQPPTSLTESAAAEPAVVVMADAAGNLVAGAIGNRSDAVAGLSNLLTGSADLDEVWIGAVAALTATFPGLPLVGYEHGVDLVAARAAGFTSIGPLRVWLNPR